MKEEILRRQDIFKGFLEKELYQNVEHEGDVRSVLNNAMTVYDADVFALLEAMKKDVGELPETTGCVGVFVFTSPTEAKGWCCPRHYGQSDLLSLLKDYNLDK